MNARYLPLTQLFELAAQAEATALPTVFPRLTERLRQEGTFRQSNWPVRNNGGHFAVDNRGQFNHHKMMQSWPPPYRTPVQRHHENVPRQQEHMGFRPSRNLPEKKSEDQLAWMRKRPCWICDKTGHLIRECTKKKTTGCPRCGKDHTLKECPSRPKATIACITTTTTSVDESEYGNLFKLIEQTGEERLQYRVEINGKDSLVLVDTGAQLSLLAKEEAERLGVTWDGKKAREDVVGADGGSTAILGKAAISINYQDGRKEESVFVAHPLRHPIILGLPWIRSYAPIIDWNELSLTFTSGEVWLPWGMQIRSKDLVAGARNAKEDEGSEECMVVMVSAPEGPIEEEVEKPRREFQVSTEIKPLLEEFHGCICSIKWYTTRR